MVGFIAKDGTSFDELCSYRVNMYGQKIIEVDRDKWTQLQRLLGYFDAMTQSDERETRARGHEGRYAVERAISIITDGMYNR